MIRSLIILSIVFISTVSRGQFTRDDIKYVKERLPKGINMRVDQYEGIIWIQHKAISLANFNVPPSYLSIYFSVRKKEGGKIEVGYIRIKNVLKLNGWIFVDKIVMLTSSKQERKDGIFHKFNIGGLGDVNRQVIEASLVSESSDIILEGQGLGFVKSIIEEKRVVNIKYSGRNEYCIRKTGGKGMQKQFKLIVQAYDALGGDFKNY